MARTSSWKRAARRRPRSRAPGGGRAPGDNGPLEKKDGFSFAVSSSMYFLYIFARMRAGYSEGLLIMNFRSVFPRLIDRHIATRYDSKLSHTLMAWPDMQS